MARAVNVPVLFTNTTDTVFGQSVFVVGNIPELGNWNPTLATKLVATACNGNICDWAVTVGIPPGTSYEYKFIKRNDCDTCYGDANNVVWEPGSNRTGSTPGLPPPPCPGKTVFYFSGWSSASLLFSNTLTGSFEQRAMQPVTNGVWRVDGINRAGEPNLTFVFTDGQGNFDNPDFQPGRNYETPLDAFVVKDGQIYNYWPPSFVSTNRVETFFKTSTNVQSRTIRVYLPRGYNENTGKRYPVLYMHDGANLFLGMGAFGSWNADTNAANLIRFGKMRETIIVGVDQTSDRLSEYQPPDCLAGTADKYAAFLIQELKPQIDTSYRTLPEPENTGAMGSSMGGLVSTYLGWEFPGVFRKIGALSTAYWRCNVTLNNLVNPPPRPVRIYLDSGDTGDFTNDGIALTMQARDNLIRNGYVFNVNLDHVIGFGQNHNEYWWDRRSPRAFTFLFPTSDEPNSVLDTFACPPVITAYTGTNLTWTSYRARTYTVQGSTNVEFSSSMNWSNLVTTAPEPQPWGYPTAPVGGPFRFFRVRQNQ